MASKKVPMRPFLLKTWENAVKAREPMIEDESLSEMQAEFEALDFSIPSDEVALEVSKKEKHVEENGKLIDIPDCETSVNINTKDVTKTKDTLKALQWKVQTIEECSGGLVYELIESFIEILSDDNLEKKKQKYLNLLKELSSGSTKGDLLLTQDMTRERLNRKYSFTVDPKEVSDLLKRPIIDADIPELKSSNARVLIPRPSLEPIGDSPAVGGGNKSKSISQEITKLSDPGFGDNMKYGLTSRKFPPYQDHGTKTERRNIEMSSKLNIPKTLSNVRQKKKVSLFKPNSPLKATIPLKDIICKPSPYRESSSKKK